MERPPGGTPPSPYETTAWAAELSDSVPMADLHGMDTHDAIREVDRLIDGAFMAGEEAIKIMHGKGAGTLRRAIREHLGSQPLVAYFRDTQVPRQERAVTVVVLHKK